ncbi:MAG: metalloenzyme [Verrucomicrobia bacterium]|nr:metalloenzyme [Verrucomicrobiota bacterium]
MRHVLLVFVDGLGLGESDPRVNPLYRGNCPFLVQLLEERAVPVDPTLDVPGFPQSATGQATIFTGVNAAKLMGRHVTGLPGPRLKELVREQNIYKKLAEQGLTSTFANAYYMETVEDVLKFGRQSVSTTAALSAFGFVRLADDLRNDNAVYQDLTRECLKSRGYEGPFISPEEAGTHLFQIALQYDFTLFEYFQTDLMAHRGTGNDVARILGLLNSFLQAVVAECRENGLLFLMISDHGNIEDSLSSSHTMNPVPLVAIGPGSDEMKQVRKLEEFADALVSLKSRPLTEEPGVSDTGRREPEP